MKVTVVPAQVTTVEDKIMGSLGFSQLVLLILPVFGGAGIYAGLPPFMAGSFYKYAAIGVFTVICCLLAIRIKGKILAHWLIVMLRYNLRPKYYLFNKNTSALRQQYISQSKETKTDKSPVQKKETAHTPALALSETVKIYTAINNPASKLRFETTKKGGLHVRLTQIEK